MAGCQLCAGSLAVRASYLKALDPEGTSRGSATYKQQILVEKVCYKIRNNLRTKAFSNTKCAKLLLPTARSFAAPFAASDNNVGCFAGHSQYAT